MTNLSDNVVNLVAGQLAALTGLRALRHLDLDFVGVHQIISRYAEAAGGYLFDRAAPRIAVGIRYKSRLIFAAFTGIRFRANAVHRNRQRLVSLF